MNTSSVSKEAAPIYRLRSVTIGLFVPVLRKPALQLLAGMVSVFIGYSLWRWLQNIPVPCHCFGALFTMSPWQSILMNLALLSMISGLLAVVSQKTGAPSQRTA